MTRNDDTALRAGVTLARQAAGSWNKLAQLLGVSKQAVKCWGRIPIDRVAEIEIKLGLAAALLRPDLFA